MDESYRDSPPHLDSPLFLAIIRPTMTTLTDRHASELFLSQLRHPDVPTWLVSPEFEHNPAAQRTLEHLAQEPEFAATLPYLLAALDSAASPDRALINFDRFIGNNPDPPALFRQLTRHPRALEILITLFAGSQFLTEILLRHPDYFYQFFWPAAWVTVNRQGNCTMISAGIGPAFRNSAPGYWGDFF